MATVVDEKYEKWLADNGDNSSVYLAICAVRSSDGDKWSFRPGFENFEEGVAWSWRQVENVPAEQWVVAACADVKPGEFPDYTYELDTIAFKKADMARDIADIFGMLCGSKIFFVVDEDENGCVDPGAVTFAEHLIQGGAKLVFDELGLFSVQAEPLLPMDALKLELWTNELGVALGLRELDDELVVKVNIPLPEDAMSSIAKYEFMAFLPELGRAFVSDCRMLPDFDVVRALTFGSLESTVPVMRMPYEFPQCPFYPNAVSDEVKVQSPSWMKMSRQQDELTGIAKIWKRLLENEHTENGSYNIFDDGNMLDEDEQVDFESLWVHAQAFGVDKAVELYLSGEVELDDIIA